MHQHPQFENLYVLDHPLIAHKLTHMRKTGTSTKTFRALLRELSMLMGYEITRSLPIDYIEIETPMEVMKKAPVIGGKKVGVVPILRAGSGMADGLLDLMPSARVGHIGLYRDPETKRPVEYLVKLPSVKERRFIVTDPMLATGHSASYALDVLNKRGVPDESIHFMALVAAPDGVQVLLDNHPKVKVFLAGLDDRLNDNAYIMPGLGDAGDRLFGTR